MSSQEINSHVEYLFASICFMSTYAETLTWQYIVQISRFHYQAGPTEESIKTWFTQCNGLWFNAKGNAKIKLVVKDFLLFLQTVDASLVYYCRQVRREINI